MIQKEFFLISFAILISIGAYAQHGSSPETKQNYIDQSKPNEIEQVKFKHFTISGYIQTQFQYGEKDATLRIGAINNNPNKPFNRFGIRRGRVKMTYEKNIATGVFQLDITEKKIRLRDAYLLVKDPWVGSNSIRVGVFDRIFGFEVPFSSSRRESPERARIITTLFPDEKDMGVMMTLQAPKNSPLSIFKLDAGLIAGNTINADLDNRKDFIGHLSINQTLNPKTKLSGGVSYYLGEVYQGSSTVYTMNGVAFTSNYDTSNFGAFAKREYIGCDIQFSISSFLGNSSIYGEYIIGTQPGDKNGSNSPNYSTLPTHNTYIRNFYGYYITYVQDLGKSPLSLIIKYDYYDPNTKVSKNNIGLKGTGKGDIAYSTFGGGLMWHINNTLRLTAYYDFISNETSSNLAEYNNDFADNIFTLRLQYKY